MKIGLYILDKHRKQAEFYEMPLVGDDYSDDEKYLKLTHKVFKDGKVIFTCIDATEAFKLIAI